ncbi:hypothetical protein B0H15DRAFT_802274 [Mycena belliarum]|uniref:Uncharacterized protein n=1 Tax=Mycena belliarum TaxID=1033014 RepID=A0AAD6U2Q9_9AGAR|nr:hypothetical protein B0H15DRAFT_802274 [Mycena belliae]
MDGVTSDPESTLMSIACVSGERKSTEDCTSSRKSSGVLREFSKPTESSSLQQSEENGEVFGPNAPTEQQHPSRQAHRPRPPSHPCPTHSGAATAHPQRSRAFGRVSLKSRGAVTRCVCASLFLPTCTRALQLKPRTVCAPTPVRSRPTTVEGTLDSECATALVQRDGPRRLFSPSPSGCATPALARSQAPAHPARPPPFYASPPLGVLLSLSERTQPLRLYLGVVLASVLEALLQVIIACLSLDRRGPAPDASMWRLRTQRKSWCSARRRSRMLGFWNAGTRSCAGGRAHTGVGARGTERCTRSSGGTLPPLF